MERKLRYARMTNTAWASSTNNRLVLPQRLPLRKLIIDFYVLLGGVIDTVTAMAPTSLMTRIILRAGSTPIIDAPGNSLFLMSSCLGIDRSFRHRGTAVTACRAIIEVDFTPDLALQVSKYSEVALEINMGAATLLEDTATITDASTWIDVYGVEQDWQPRGFNAGTPERPQWIPATRRFLHQSKTPAASAGNTISMKERAWYNNLLFVCYDTEYTIQDAIGIGDTPNVSDFEIVLNLPNRPKDVILAGQYSGMARASLMDAGIAAPVTVAGTAGAATNDDIVGYNGMLYVPLPSQPDLRAPSSELLTTFTSAGTSVVHSMEDVCVPD